MASKGHPGHSGATTSSSMAWKRKENQLSSANSTGVRSRVEAIIPWTPGDYVSSWRHQKPWIRVHVPFPTLLSASQLAAQVPRSKTGRIWVPQRATNYTTVVDGPPGEHYRPELNRHLRLFM